MDGILPLWKERGMTSHDCVFKLRKILKTKKVGHGGTLDPDVDGVLPICIGKGTKVIEYLTDSGKIYQGEIMLGFSTTTEDVSGEIVEITSLQQPFTEAEIDEVMASFIGEITQIPPMYSAVKVNGKRLYEYARNGETVERPQRKAKIESFRRIGAAVWLPEKQQQSWRFEVVCGKGTYVRTLAVDTGKKLGVAAHMSDLTRTASGGFTKEQAKTLAEVAAAMENQRIDDILLPIETAMAEFPRVDLSLELWEKVKNGVPLAKSILGIEADYQEEVALFYQDLLVSVYKEHPTKVNILKPSKVLRNSL
ncbi:tRNA pseudouridine55 synthase [Enterococcus sp. PF1-24]|uniref:tRNA pseudouridine(55) synthase TruB n=1 Tax=unclassified Enterococcus TaxID=2608891 RepID=UPI0024758DFF|nr:MULTISPECIES: tRNA pseudouridine(55) synthase TruB [unclassified Enterococcus]MDH6363035.1 tRNA pseudouridine55 synthase [Enterococcus sp. PFB1-1]MDH6400129.1 tRNA pseudouridine55 synthase [Enterococcus sp. PF1-24]